jgi:DNA-binding transcriptional MerR regulator
LRTIDESHAGRLRDRATLDAVATAIGALTGPPNDGPLEDGAFWTIGELARRLGVTPATLRKWERTGILHPARDRFTGHRRYDIADIRDAELAYVLRRRGYLLADIAPVVAQVREAGGPELLVESLVVWRQRLTNRSRAMLTAAGHLADYLEQQGRVDRNDEPGWLVGSPVDAALARAQWLIGGGKLPGERVAGPQPAPRDDESE